MDPWEYFFFLQIIPSSTHPPERLRRRAAAEIFSASAGRRGRKWITVTQETGVPTRRAAPVWVRAGIALETRDRGARPHHAFSRRLGGNSRHPVERGPLGGGSKAARSQSDGTGAINNSSRSPPRSGFYFRARSCPPAARRRSV